MLNVGFFLLKSLGTLATSAISLPLEPVLLANAQSNPTGQFLARGEQNVTNVYPRNTTSSEEAEGGNMLTT